MQTLAHPLAPPPFTPQHPLRSAYPHPHRPGINGSVTRPAPTATGSGLPLAYSAAVPTPPISTAVARKRKRPTTLSVNITEVEELDADGHLRQVIVIDDTPPPPPTLSPAVSSSTTTAAGYSMSMQPPIFGAPVRTRARAAAEAQVLQYNSSTTTASASVSALAGPAPKRRRREPELNGISSAKKTLPATKYALAPASKAWPSASVSTTDDVSKTAPPCDDKEGHYIVLPNDMIYKRYRTVRLLGQGTFGKVVEAVDTTNSKRVAIKIIRAIPKYRDASKIEVRVLQKLKEKDPLNRNKCVHLLNWFDHRNHICLVTELLGMCVYDFLKENEFQPFPRKHIQDFARQLLGSVAFLHDLHLVHTDLKPENILLVHNSFRTVNYVMQHKRGAPIRTKRILASTDIRLIDFGSATFENEYHSTVVSTRHYRAPEIILGLGWSYPCDAFSLGCILVEFYTGVALFQTHDNLEHLAMMEMVMGKMPERFGRSGARSKPEYFKEGSKLDWPKPKATRQSKKDVRSTRSLQELLPPRDEINRLFLDLVQRLLAFDPAQRIAVREALQHPYFSLPMPMEDF